LDTNKTNNKLHQILSPNANDDGVWIHQNAWFHIGNLDQGTTLQYELKDKRNGVYAFVISGDVTVAGQELNHRDGYGIWDVLDIVIKADSKTTLLLMEVPMSV
jgi:redox-sensitive bicupin YhaK (pirin superfamily)